jgi:hypothetical protein
MQDEAIGLGVVGIDPVNTGGAAVGERGGDEVVGVGGLGNLAEVEPTTEVRPEGQAVKGELLTGDRGGAVGLEFDKVEVSQEKEVLGGREGEPGENVDLPVFQTGNIGQVDIDNSKGEGVVVWGRVAGGELEELDVALCSWRKGDRSYLVVF